MRIAYVDESGRDDRLYFIGVLLADSQGIRHVQASFDRIGQVVADAHPEFDPTSEFHGYDIFHGVGEWRGIGASVRAKASALAIKSIANSAATFIFRGIHVPDLRQKYTNPHPTHELAFAQALESADEWLEGIGEYAIVVADDHHTAEDGRRRFRRMTLGPQAGYSNRALTQLIDSVYFGPSTHSRLLQAADMASYFTNRILTIPEESEAAKPWMRRIEESLEACTHRVHIWPH